MKKSVKKVKSVSDVIIEDVRKNYRINLLEVYKVRFTYKKMTFINTYLTLKRLKDDLKKCDIKSHRSTSRNLYIELR